MKLIISLIGLLACASCTQRVADFTVCSTKNMDLNRVSGYVSETNERTTGIDTSHTHIQEANATPNSAARASKGVA